MSDRSTSRPPAAAGTAVPDADPDDSQGEAVDDADAEPRSPSGPPARLPGAHPC